MERKDIIKDNRTGKIYFDTGIIRNFETVLATDLDFNSAKKKYPEIIDPKKNESTKTE